MTQEEKDLLKKDLCARLPYGVKCTTRSIWNDVYLMTGCKDNRIYLDCPVYEEGDDEWLVESVVPYLRPMSSMTEEEKTWATASYDYNKITYGLDYAITAYVDYLYSIHVDCHGLIPVGLALKAPKDMYKNKEEQQ